MATNSFITHPPDIIQNWKGVRSRFLRCASLDLTRTLSKVQRNVLRTAFGIAPANVLTPLVGFFLTIS